MNNDITKFCHYYKGEETNPFDIESRKYLFWDLEKMYWSGNINREEWENISKKYINNMRRPIEEKGFIMYAEEMLRKWCPNKTDIIFEYDK